MRTLFCSVGVVYEVNNMEVSAATVGRSRGREQQLVIQESRDHPDVLVHRVPGNRLMVRSG
jgi:hypothetical protein